MHNTLAFTVQVRAVANKWRGVSMKQSDVSKWISLGKNDAKWENGQKNKETVFGRIALPHGWLVVVGGGAVCFVPFADNGTGWGKNDPVQIKVEE